MQLNGIRWQYDIHGRTTEKDNGQTRWRFVTTMSIA
jgi:hypothetical protein